MPNVNVSVFEAQAFTFFDDLSVMEPHNQSVALIGIPWYNVIGNHDLNTDAQTSSSSSRDMSKGIDSGTPEGRAPDATPTGGAVSAETRRGRGGDCGVHGVCAVVDRFVWESLGCLACMDVWMYVCMDG